MDSIYRDTLQDRSPWIFIEFLGFVHTWRLLPLVLTPMAWINITDIWNYLLLYLYWIGLYNLKGVTVVLTMAFLAIDTRTDLPKVSYSTALDYYVGICFAFVLATIIQFAGVHYFTKIGYGEIEPESESEDEADQEEIENEYRNSTSLMDKVYVVNRHKRPSYYDRVNGSGFSYKNTYNDYETDREENSWKPIRVKDNCCYKFFQCLIGNIHYRTKMIKSSPKGTGVNSVSMIDKTARVAFPAAFIIINIVYWTYFTRTDDKLRPFIGHR